LTLWPWSSAPQLGDFPWPSGGTGLRGGEEPSYRAAIRRLLIREHAGFGYELAQVPVDVLFTMGTRASRIVAETVKSTPLVVYSCDPFEHVTHLARGRGNLTGVTMHDNGTQPETP
jgi:hypothetical protein